MKQIKNLRSMSDDQLKRRNESIRVELMRLKGFNRVASLPDSSMLGRLKKERAQILTILHERRLKRND